MEPEMLNLFHKPSDRLRLTVADDRSYVTVKPVWAAPISHPGRYLSLMDGAGDEIVTVIDPGRLSKSSRDSILLELRRRYLTAVVSHIVHARQEYGATYWTVETDRGFRDFVTQSLQENAQWHSDTHLLLLDVDGNRYEIPDVAALDDHSRAIIDEIL